jgi:lipopolysaccharide biosynthesis glycosyltransferase
MPEKVFCTIITSDYLHYALSLRESLIRFNTEIKFYILVAENHSELKIEVEKKYSDTIVLSCDNVCKDGIGKKIYDKYFINHKDEFRWSMKPVLLKHLIENLNVTKVLYLDCDLFFFTSYDFLFERLNTSHVILTPHWRSSNPHMDSSNFRNLLNDGLYNAGFIGVNKVSIEIMEWWAMVCEYECTKQTDKGYFVDQAYLNIIPIKFENVEVLRHKGCNVANWNQLECKRIVKENGRVWINGVDPIVFIHFTASTIRGIVNGTDNLLIPYLEDYSNTIKKYAPGIDILEKHKILSQALPVNSETTKFRSRLKNWFK